MALVNKVPDTINICHNKRPPNVSAGNRHICITRPRRFGKTIMANMISSFFQKIPDSGDGKNT